ncbi:hypothetical protein [Streptomyces phaeochromogenes]
MARAYGVDKAEAERALDVLRVMADQVRGEIGEPLPLRTDPVRGATRPDVVPAQPMCAPGPLAGR